MKNLQQEAKRWYRQAEYDLIEANASQKRGSFAYACFFAEQAAQKFLKSYLILNGHRFIPIHSIGELLEKAAQIEYKFTKLIDDGKRLDRYYLITRYPDALPSPAIPYESYGQKEAREAVKIAKKIAGLIKILKIKT